MNRLARPLLSYALLAAAFIPALAQNTEATKMDAPPTISVSIDARAPTTPFPHFWEQIFGSGRAILSLRQSYRDDLKAVKSVTDLQAVRFHAIFLDDVGFYDPNAQTQNPGQAPTAASPGQSPYNFSYVDQIYDGLLSSGVRPFVELSFMPKKMASDPAALHPFWYKQNVSPPKDYALWDAMITAFTEHLVQRYGLDEVSKWYFEVWNEPNIDFWAGNPKQSTYFELYDHTATAIKKVSSRIRVGGPATAQAAWVGEFLAHCKQNHIPVDFASTHVYANDTAKDVFHSDEQIPRDRMVCRSVKKVHEEIISSSFPKMPLIVSEYNASYANEPDVTDSVYMGPWLAGTISQCDGMTEAMSYWAFSDVFEEQGVVKTPFYGGFGLMAEDNIPKPALNAFAMFHQLGSLRIKVDSDSVLATRLADGSLAIVLWNYAAPFGTGAAYTPPPDNPGPAKSFEVTFAGVPPSAAVQIWRLDQDHGNVVKAFDTMGRPPFPTREQLHSLRLAGKAAAVERSMLHGGKLTIAIPSQGLVLVKLPRKAAGL